MKAKILNFGKGVNQSIALARAGVSIFHVGSSGIDKDLLEKNNVNTQFILSEITKDSIDTTFSKFDPGDYLLLQNEPFWTSHLIEKGHRKGMKICFYPYPMTSEVRDYPLDLCDYIVVTKGSLLEATKCIIAKGNSAQAIDTFIGYYLASLIQEKSPQEALQIATNASTFADARSKDVDPIPMRDEIQ